MYDQLDDLLRENPKILAVVHEELSQTLSVSKKGRCGDYTSDQIFRSILVMFLESYTYREAVTHIERNDVLNRFVGLGIKPVMDPGFLSKG